MGAGEREALAPSAAAAATPRGSIVESFRSYGIGGGGWRAKREELRQRVAIPGHIRAAMAAAMRSKDPNSAAKSAAAAATSNKEKEEEEEDAVAAGAAIVVERRVEEELPEAPMVAFVNSRSGGRHGSILKGRLQELIGEEQYLELYLTRVDGLRRRIPLDGEKDSAIDFQLIRQTFMDAVDFLSPQLSTDDLLHMHEYWARLEANLGKEMVAARGVWENLIKKSGSMLEVWQHYIAMEIEMGHIQEARAIYKRCYSKRFSGTGSEVVCHSWLRFEREHGTLEDFDLAVKKVTPRLHELMIFKNQQESKTGAAYSVTKDTHEATKSPQKRKMNQLSSNRQPPPKRRKEGTSKTVESSDVGRTKKLRNATELRFYSVLSKLRSKWKFF